MTQMSLLPENYAEKLFAQYTFDIDYGTTTEDLTCIRCKKLLNDAYQTHCGCQYCRTCIVEYLSQGERHCCGCKQCCNEVPLVLDKTVHKSAMLNRRVLSVKVICPNESCMHITEFVQMEDHLRVCTKQSIECPYSSLGCDTEKVTKDTILTHLDTETLQHTQLLVDLIQNLRNEVGALKDKLEISSQTNKTEIPELRTAIERIKEESAEKENRIAVLEQESRDKDDRISILELESKNTNRTNSDTRTRIDQLATTIDGINIDTNTMVAIGVTAFTVNSFDARRTAEARISSPYFYSHSNGYKLRLIIYTGGLLGGGNHLSVYIQICEGIYDDILLWPCKYTFEVALINQSKGGTHFTGTLSYDLASNDCQYYFDKPINGDNVEYGFPKFVSVADLRSVVGLIVDDSVTILCTVRPPS